MNSEKLNKLIGLVDELSVDKADLIIESLEIMLSPSSLWILGYEKRVDSMTQTGIIPCITNLASLMGMKWLVEKCINDLVEEKLHEG